MHLLLSFSCSVMSDSATRWTPAHQASLSFIISQSLLKSMSIESVMLSNHLILCTPFSFCLQSFLGSGSSPESAFSYQVARVLELQHQSFQWIFRIDFFRIDWLDSLAVQGTLKSSPAPQFRSINSSALSLLFGPILTCVCDYWKNHSIDYMDLSRQSDVSAL